MSTSRLLRHFQDFKKDRVCSSRGETFREPSGEGPGVVKAVLFSERGHGEREKRASGVARGVQPSRGPPARGGPGREAFLFIPVCWLRACGTQDLGSCVCVCGGVFFSPIETRMSV